MGRPYLIHLLANRRGRIPEVQTRAWWLTECFRIAEIGMRVTRRKSEATCKRCLQLEATRLSKEPFKL